MRVVLLRGLRRLLTTFDLAGHRLCDRLTLSQQSPIRIITVFGRQRSLHARPYSSLLCTGCGLFACPPSPLLPAWKVSPHHRHHVRRLPSQHNANEGINRRANDSHQGGAKMTANTRAFPLTEAVSACKLFVSLLSPPQT